LSALRFVHAGGAVACILAVIASSGGGSVMRYAPCGASDTCPSATTCESIATGLGPMCTWSCNDDDIDPESCPNDANGVQGVCAGSVGDVAVGSFEFGMCFQHCATTADCPDGAACVDATALGSQLQTKVCAAVPTDAIAGTSWQSATITKTAKSNGVQTSTYTMMFGAQTGYEGGMAQGTFTATLVQVYGSATLQTAYEGCTETTTYTGGMWSDRAPTSSQVGNLDITNTTSSTDRTGCTTPEWDVTGELDDYSITDGVAGYYLSTDGSTLNMGGGYGSLPYDDSVEWTFTKQ
jgi:hypothetical protein